MAPKTAAEAQKLIDEAERDMHYTDDEDALVEKAKEALEFFRGQGEKGIKGVADAIRMLVTGNLLKVEKIRMTLGNNAEPIAKRIEEMDTLLHKELDRCRESGDTYGEAQMMTSLAEINFDFRGQEKRQEAIDLAVKGSEIAEKAGDKLLQARLLYIVAIIKTKLRDAEAALEAAEKGLKLFEEVDDKTSLCKMYHAIAAAHEVHERYQEMFAAGRKALAVAREMDDKRMIEFQCRAIAEWYIRIKKAKEALPFAKEALAICEALGPESGVAEADARRMVMACHSLKGDMAAAVKVAAESVKIYEERGMKTELVMAYDALCHMYLGKTCGEEAMKAAEAGLEVAKEIGDKRWQSILLQTLSNIHNTMNQYDDADARLKEAQEMCQEMGEDHEEAHLLHDHVALHICNGKLDAALELCEEELSHAKSTNNQRGEGFALLNLATAHGSKAQFDEAVKAGNDALDIFTEIKETRAQAYCHRALAEIHVNNEETDLALEHASTMREMFEELVDFGGQANAWKLLTDVYLAREEYQEAVEAATTGRLLAKKTDDKRKEIEMLMSLSSAQLKLICADAERSKDKRLRGASKALKPAKEARAIAKKVGDRNMLGNAMYMLAEAQAVTGRLDEALKTGLATASLFRETVEPQNEVLAIVLCGEIMNGKGETEKAKETVQRAYDIATQIGDEYGQYRAAKVLEELEPKKGAAAEAARPTDAGEVYQEAEQPQAAMSKGLDPEFVKKMVHETVLSVVGGDEDSLMWDSPLMDSGMDSLSSVQFRNELQRQAGFSLPAAMIFDYPSQAQIADHLVEQSRLMPAK